MGQAGLSLPIRKEYGFNQTEDMLVIEVHDLNFFAGCMSYAARAVGTHKVKQAHIFHANLHTTIKKGDIDILKSLSDAVGGLIIDKDNKVYECPNCGEETDELLTDENNVKGCIVCLTTG